MIQAIFEIIAAIDLRGADYTDLPALHHSHTSATYSGSAKYYRFCNAVVIDITIAIPSISRSLEERRSRC